MGGTDTSPLPRTPPLRIVYRPSGVKVDHGPRGSEWASGPLAFAPFGVRLQSLLPEGHKEHDSRRYISVANMGLLQVREHVDSSSWTENDWDPDGDFDHNPEALAVDTTPAEAQISLLTVEELQQAQETDPLCQIAKADIDNNRPSPYVEDERGLIVRIASVDDAVQILCPVGLRQKVLFLSHYTPIAGHPGITKQYYSQRRSFYWPTMLADIRRCANECHQCARERTKLRNHAAPMQLFPASSPLEFVAIDILGPLTVSTKGHKFILVMTDRFSKMVRAVPLRSISALTVAKVFVRDWVFVYGPPAKLLPTAKWNASTEHSRWTPCIRRGPPQKMARIHIEFGFAYNTQVHRSTGVAPFDLVLSRPPGPITMKVEQSLEDSKSHGHAKLQFLAQMRRLVGQSQATLAKAQARYKRDFDKRVRPSAHIEVGDQIYLERQGPVANAAPGDKQRHKLQSKADGPYPVVAITSHTVTITRDGLNEKVTRDRVAKAPPPPTSPPTSNPSGTAGTRPTPHRASPPVSITEEHVLDRIVDYDRENDVFRTRWHGYDATADSMEPPEHLPYNALISYFRHAKQAVPTHIHHFSAGN
eukprot:IDg8354t1